MNKGIYSFVISLIAVIAVGINVKEIANPIKVRPIFENESSIEFILVLIFVIS